LASREKGHEQAMPSKTSGKDVRRQNLSALPRKDDGIRVCSPACSRATQGKKAGTYSVEDGGYFIALCKSISSLERPFGELSLALQFLLHLVITLSC